MGFCDITIRRPHEYFAQTSIKTAYEHLNKVYAAQVAKNWVPGDGWKGSEVDRKAIQEAVGTQYAKQLPDDEIIKSHITSEAFSEVWEAWWDWNDVLHVAYAGYVHVATVMKHKSGSYRVIGSSFRRTLSGDKWLAPKKCGRTCLELSRRA